MEICQLDMREFPEVSLYSGNVLPRGVGGSVDGCEVVLVDL